MNFQNSIINWFESNKRDLPWRKTKDPYKIWLSEIILQQTRVNQGLSYYLKFVNEYPTIADLAKASEVEVLKNWQGLGYYSRARNMLATAQIVAQMESFPNTYAELLKLKGIGEYTAAAISSFSSNEERAVVDGNVFRVLARYFGIKNAINSSSGKKEFQQVALELLPTNYPGLYNQSIMEFGALMCTPKKPNCKECPLVSSCFAFKNQEVENLPVKIKKKKPTPLYIEYAVFTYEGRYALQKRGNNGIWAGLFEFPNLTTEQDRLTSQNIFDSFEEALELKINYEMLPIASSDYSHILSHKKILARFWKFEISLPYKRSSKMVFSEPENLKNYPIPRLMEKYLQIEEML